jgi:hypothetical protein
MSKPGTSATSPQSTPNPHRPVTVTPTVERGSTKTISLTSQPGVTQPQPGGKGK